MGGSAFGLLAVIAFVFLAKRFGLRWPGRDWRLIAAAACFGVGLFAQFLALGGADTDVCLSFGLFAFAGWAVLLFEVFYAVRAADVRSSEVSS